MQLVVVLTNRRAVLRSCDLNFLEHPNSPWFNPITKMIYPSSRLPICMCGTSLTRPLLSKPEPKNPCCQNPNSERTCACVHVRACSRVYVRFRLDLIEKTHDAFGIHICLIFTQECTCTHAHMHAYLCTCICARVCARAPAYMCVFNWI